MRIFRGMATLLVVLLSLTVGGCSMTPVPSRTPDISELQAAVADVQGPVATSVKMDNGISNTSVTIEVAFAEAGDLSQSTIGEMVEAIRVSKPDTIYGITIIVTVGDEPAPRNTLTELVRATGVKVLSTDLGLVTFVFDSGGGE